MLKLSPGVERKLLLRDFGVLEGGQAVVLQLVGGALLHHLRQVLVHVHLSKEFFSLRIKATNKIMN